MKLKSSDNEYYKLLLAAYLLIVNNFVWFSTPIIMKVLKKWLNKQQIITYLNGNDDVLSQLFWLLLNNRRQSIEEVIKDWWPNMIPLNFWNIFFFIFVFVFAIRCRVCVVDFSIYPVHKKKKIVHLCFILFFFLTSFCV